MYGVKSHANLIYIILNILMSVNLYLNCELESYSTEIQDNFNSKLKYLEKVLQNVWVFGVFFFLSFRSFKKMGVYEVVASVSSVLRVVPMGTSAKP